MENWRASLERWAEAGLIEPAVAERIRAYEARHAGPRRLHWPVLLALIFGAIAVGAGVLLFVAAHWDWLSPAARFALVMLLVAIFHVAGALQSSDGFRQTFHALGTSALGACIFLTGQIFHLAANWPSGLLLWAAAAWIGWLLLRDLPQAALAAVLTPAWLAMQYHDWAGPHPETWPVISLGLALVAITYFTAATRQRQDGFRKGLVWIGGFALLPAVISTAQEFPRAMDWPPLILGWAVAAALTGALAWLLRGPSAWMNAVATLWLIALALLAHFSHLLVYLWCALGSAGMVAWGLKENRRERIDFGVAGFALTVIFFYVSNVLDKMQRSVSLIGLGVLLLGGGYLLERARKRLVSSI